MTRCAIETATGIPCAPAAEGAPLPLCAEHLLVAADHAAWRFGETDTMESPCRACGSWLGVRYPSGWICAVCEWKAGEIPDSDAPIPRIDVVYYIRYRDRIKIGTSATPRSRIAALPCDEVLAFERGDRGVEQARHVQFAADRLGTGEWFAPSAALVAHIAEVSAGVSDPWNLYSRWLASALAR